MDTSMKGLASEDVLLVGILNSALYALIKCTLAKKEVSMLNHHSPYSLTALLAYEPSIFLSKT